MNVPRYHASLRAEDGLKVLPNVIQTAGFVFDKFGAVARFMRKYNALPRVANCLKIILSKFNAGRQFLMHYNLVKAKNEGPALLASKIPAGPAQIIPSVRIIPIPLTLPRNRVTYFIRSFPYTMMPGYRTLAFRKPTCTCLSRKEWRRVNYFQNRRKRWPRKMRPFRIKPSIQFVAPWTLPQVTIATPKLTVAASKRLLDILANPNQVPYYANLALDVFDTHFDSWNAKIKTAYNTIKEKLEKTIGNRDENSEYDNYLNGTESSSNTSSSSEYDYSSDEDNSTSASTSESDSGTSRSDSDESESYTDSESTSDSEQESSYTDDKTDTSQSDTTNEESVSDAGKRDSLKISSTSSRKIPKNVPKAS